MTSLVRNASRLFAVCSAFLVLGAMSAQAQQTRYDTSKSTYGIFGDAAWNLYTANFQTLPGIPNCCTAFQTGNGFGFNAGLFYDYDAFGPGHIGVRAGIASLNGTLKANESVELSVNGIYQQGIVQYTIASTFTVASIVPYYAYDFGGLRLMLGPDIGIIFPPTYNQAETIVQPTNEGVFVNTNERTRNVYSGNIPDAATLRIGAMAGVSYPLPLNSSGSLHLIPEVSFDYGITNMVSGLSWTASALRAGASIGYTPIYTIEPPPPPPPPAPPPPPRPTLFVDIKAYSVTNGVKDSAHLSVAVEEFYSTTQTPLLPFVLFGLDSSNIPSRYHSISATQAADFDEHKKTDSTDNVRVYHDILNIIGKRMREHPKARLTLTGCTSNEPEELADNGLALSRADKVGIYIENTWGISPTRVTLESRGLPEKPSSLTQPDGKEENRRVEIAASDPAILAPVQLADTQLTTNPPGMEFVPTVRAQAGVKHFDMYVTQPVMTLYHEFGSGRPKTWDWDLSAVSAKIPRTEDTIEYGLTVTDSIGQEVTSVGTIPVRQTTISKKRQERLADKVIERYTLVLFDFGSSKIDPQNERAIEYIRQQITPGTSVYITGYADRSGEEALDQQLTEDRARAVAKLLNATDYVSKGVGKSQLLFDNNTPEGRFYSRTVNIVLYKKINQ